MSRFDEYALELIRGAAVTRLIAMPGRCRLQGMTRDLTADECRTLAYFEASVEALNRMELPLSLPDFPKLITFTLQHDILDEEMEGVQPGFK